MTIADQAAAQLREAEDRVARLADLVAGTVRDVREQRAEIEALDERLAAIAEDRARYLDAIRLRDLGSVQQLAVANSRCPTCDQQLPQTLLGGDLRPVMTRTTTRRCSMRSGRRSALCAKTRTRVALASSQKLVGLRRELDEARKDVRAYKATLTQHAQAPSRAVASPSPGE